MGIDKISRLSLRPNEKAIDNKMKIEQFSKAIERYKRNPWYSRFQILVSIVIVLSQGLSVFHLIQSDIKPNLLIIGSVFLTAYITTDFINGLVHMYMDNNTNYTSSAGPFIAAFHLHHSHPQYIRRHPLKIYFFESGTKFWLLGYLLVLILLQQVTNMPYSLNYGLVFIGILSSVAEVSHYWCHTATKQNKIIMLLQKGRLLLSIKHHVHHHRSDNTHYAFLNGVSDPLLNLIANYYYPGYKNHADQHTAAYMKKH
ncbi:fatty acid desaturase CarF family protein [uncultured Legionella sp.]|uniref:fatty acid desaturase CarF family protein n=1 Tax=uncultured Legionella sp. TaxID=210934 RepID=UPI002627452A|nr:fatty acid desaturase CarF family protein [uncultured Legionella sp.]